MMSAPPWQHLRYEPPSHLDDVRLRKSKEHHSPLTQVAFPAAQNKPSPTFFSAVIRGREGVSLMHVAIMRDQGPALGGAVNGARIRNLNPAYREIPWHAESVPD